MPLAQSHALYVGNFLGGQSLYRATVRLFPELLLEVVDCPPETLFAADFRFPTEECASECNIWLALLGIVGWEWFMNDRTGAAG